MSRGFWYRPCFFSARLVVYCVSAGMLLIMLFADPFHYQCGIDFVCPGCGVKTGVFNLLRGNVEGAVRCNPFSVAVILAAVFSVVDTFVGLIRK